MTMENKTRLSEEQIRQASKIMTYQMQKAATNDVKVSIEIPGAIVMMIDDIRDMRFRRFITQAEVLSEFEMGLFLDRNEFIKMFFVLTLGPLLTNEFIPQSEALDALFGRFREISEELSPRRDEESDADEESGEEPAEEQRGE